MQKLSPGENCLLGIVTGVMSKACNYPLLVWKNTVQQGLKISLDPRIVYRGLPMACLNLGGTNAVQFASTGFFQNCVARTGADATTSQVLARPSTRVHSARRAYSFLLLPHVSSLLISSP